MWSLVGETLNEREHREHWRYILCQNETDKELIRQEEKRKREADKEEAGPSGLKKFRDITLSVMRDTPDSDSDSN